MFLSLDIQAIFKPTTNNGTAMTVAIQYITKKKRSQNQLLRFKNIFAIFRHIDLRHKQLKRKSAQFVKKCLFVNLLIFNRRRRFVLVVFYFNRFSDNNTDK